MAPVPEGTPEPRFSHYHRGRPDRVFDYRDQEGRLLGYSCLFPNSRGGFETIPLTWCRNPENEHAWRWQQFGGGLDDRLRPLYGLDRLAAADRDGRHVLLVGDEHSAMHAQRIFPQYIVMSWPGGFRRVGHVDWSPLKDAYTVWIWPDHGAQPFRVNKGDPQTGQIMPMERQPAFRAAHDISAKVRELGVKVITIVQANAEDMLPDGWNIARACLDGWSDELVNAWFGAHHFGQARPPEHFKVDPPEPALEGDRLVLPPAQPGQGGKGGDSASTPTAGSAASDDKAEPVDASWADKLLRKDGSGPLLPELYNVRTLLSHHPEWRDVIYLDEFAQRVMKGKPPPFVGGSVGEWSDTDDSQAHEWLSVEAGVLKIRTSTVGQAVQTVAKLNSRNPLVDRLRSLKWDGTPRLDTWLRCYLGATPTPDATVGDMERLDRYLAIVGRKWLLGAVARAFVPGIKFDYVLVLEGQQGLGKSGAFAIIGGEWAMDTPFSLSDKEGMENIRGKWIVELAELDAFSKAESSTAKSFFSRITDRFRLPYGKRSADFKRACVFGGTTNEHEYFRDATGNRRYWPVVCRRQGFDHVALKRDLDQLLAEAVQAFDGGEQIYPDPKLERAFIHPEQDRRGVLDPWMGKIAWWLEHSDFRKMEPHAPITVRLLLEKCLALDAGRIDQHSHAIRVGRALARLGYEKHEDKSTPDRFYYVKRQGSDEDDA